MSLIQFIKEAGKKLFDHSVASPPSEPLLDVLYQQAASSDVKVQGLDLALHDDTVTVTGTVHDHADQEKLITAIGNTIGISQVDDQLTVTDATGTPSQLYTVKEGDSLSSIAAAEYKDPTKYNIIYDANTPMLKDPNEIYPGQVLRIPALEPPDATKTKAQETKAQEAKAQETKAPEPEPEHESKSKKSKW